jgi:hypothetical protein
MKYSSMLLAILLLMTSLTACNNTQVLDIVSIDPVPITTSPDGSFVVGGPQIIKIVLKNTGQADNYFFTACLNVPLATGEPPQDYYAKFNVSPVKPGDISTGTFSIPAWAPLQKYVSYPLKIHYIYENKTYDVTENITFPPR